MNFLGNILTSWKTTILGISAIMTIVAKWASAGAVDYNDIPMIIAGVTGIFAKDAGVTGTK
jgi:hypothetical protein